MYPIFKEAYWTILKQSLLGSVDWNGIVPWHGNESRSARPCSEKDLNVWSHHKSTHVLGCF